MLSGDLADAGLVDVLLELAAATTTGCVHLAEPSRGQAAVFLQGGRVYAVTATDERGGLAGLLHWPAGSWRLRLHERSAAGSGAADLLGELIDGLPAPGAVPRLSVGHASAELELDGAAWALLGRVNGVRTVAELARAERLTTYATACLVRSLVAAGLLELTDRPAGPRVPAPAELTTAAEPDDIARSVARVSAALTELFGPPRELDDAFRRPAVQPSGPAPAPEVVELPPEPEPEHEPEPEPQPEAMAEPDPGPDLPDPAALAAFASELSAAASTAPVTAASGVDVEPTVPAPDPAAAGETAEAATDEPYVRKGTDMAALLRELSSLGIDDDLPPSPPLPRAPVAAPLKKKKGLFGR